MLDADACYAILKANDPRFDGQFFVGVTSTGIYCRSVCPAKLPKRENCVFFPTAAAAEAAGFRPCLKCRPELAPGLPATLEMDDIAARVANALRAGFTESLTSMALRLGVSERHLRRVFEGRYGATPAQYRTTCRLLLAKSLLTETDLSMAKVARASGFSSTRRLQEAFSERYHMAPSRFRRESGTARGKGKVDAGTSVLLGYRKPYRWDLLLGFLEFRAIAGVESVSGGVYKRVVRLGGAEGERFGWLAARDVPEKSAVELTVSDELLDSLPLVVAKARRLFDTDCDPAAVGERLADFYERVDPAFEIPGVRVPCSFDGFEMAVRAVLGQQITVKAANTLAGRVAAAFGAPLAELGVETPFPELACAFPAPAAFCGEGVAERLGELGVIGQRARSICELARLVESGELELAPGADVRATEETLLAISGIGPWTAQYILMRALAYPDAFPAADYGVKHAFGGLTPRKIEKLSEPWRPQRSYTVMSLWSAPPEVWEEIRKREGA